MATDSVSSQITIGQPHLAKQDISKLVNKKFYGDLFNHVLFLQYGGTVSFFLLQLVIICPFSVLGYIRVKSSHSGGYKSTGNHKYR